ncbi:complement C3-like isoform X2 [Denticeps clupeoides]|uniref:complement C3-like isoform X2 n=1 Tax=Denticeps clupeoides TaxID=299321 RepID=UPI0010A36135|nr:complement C3-like isoform X2 [Denticeps clupeoides]
MRVDLAWLNVLLVALLPTPSLCQPLYVMSAPSLLRVGTRERVFVEAQDHTGAAFDVRIAVKSYPGKDRELLSQMVKLGPKNHFQVLTEMKIPENTFNEQRRKNEYVYLQAQFPGRLLEKLILVSFQSGYIFVQTDKPIYTPATTVLYRIFALSPDMQPVHSPISVEIMTPDDITIQMDTFFINKGMKSGSFKLPAIVSFGIWRVLTKLSSMPHVNFTTEFEVKEYVLPSFEITLTPRQAFFYIDDDQLTVDIAARYLFGKEVTGVAFVVFGVMTNGNEKRSLPGSLQRVEIQDGQGQAALKRAHIQQLFPNIEELIHSSIYVSVTVSTETGSEMVEAQRRGIQIVSSPYAVLFTRTPKFFKPGMPFDVSVLVTNPDNTPAEDIPVVVSPGEVVGRTKENGLAKVTVNTNAANSVLSVTVRTKAPGLSNSRQAEKKMTAQAYHTASKNFLHISVDSAELAIRDQMKISLNLGKSHAGQNHDFTYLILNKGQIVRAERFKRQGQPLVTLSLPVTKDMVPSFRIVAYYHVGSSEVVSDAVWVDVKDTCLGTLELALRKPWPAYEPRMQFTMSIKGDPGATVGLVAVDKGVYVLNKKHRLTQPKIWDVIENLDPGCTAGSGKDSMGVFYDAGLVFESNTAGGTGPRTVPTCPSPSRRRRRAVTVFNFWNTLVSMYTGLEKECCVDGMKDSPQDYACDRRADYITDGEQCVRAFLHCCNEMATKRKERRLETQVFARSEEEDDDFVSSDEIVTRTQFRESWLWEDLTLPVCPVGNKNCGTTSAFKTSFTQDSITTWEITAISLSENHGICVGKPLEIIVTKDFFIDLKLPYSAIRNEQLEIKAVLHNYNTFDITVRVELVETDKVCSSATKRGVYRVTVKMDQMSSRSVPFVIVPLALGEHSIEVRAAVKMSRQSDGVRKVLRVVPEGILTKVEVKNLLLDPSKHGGVQREEIKSVDLNNQVPNTPFNTYLSVQGEELSRTIEEAVSGKSLGSLIVQPGGCGEQNMIGMTLPVIATHYLDWTNQWDAVGVRKRDTALHYITMGYNQQLAFRKPDGSYGAWIHTTSSTWLTAYVAKVFAMASALISIQENVVCSAIKWLVLNKQQPDGLFREDAPVYHGEMGNVRGKDSDASMTAFVLIALQESRGICAGTVGSLENSINKATAYLQLRVHSLTNTYAVAMVSYAMSNEGKLDKEILFRHISSDLSSWPVAASHLFTLEATAYALLALVKVKDFDRAGPVVNWLNRQRLFNGGYGSTQSTIMVFQAVAEYRMRGEEVPESNLEINVDVASRKGSKTWTINRSNQHLTRSERLQQPNELITVTVKGTGRASLSVVTLYYAKPSMKSVDCRNFQLNVSLRKEPRVSYKGAMESFKLIIDAKFLSGERDATMSILDIGLLTGFVVDETDLTALSTGRDRYVQKFEMDKQLSERGSLILYLDQISSRRPDRIAFRMHKVLDVGLLQPAAVTVYEYYSVENRCMKFYHPSKEGGALNKICEGNICQCAEEDCSMQKKEHIQEDSRLDVACNRGRDYVYKVTVEKADLTPLRDVYTMRINSVLKEGTDKGVDGKQRSFVSHPQCRNVLDLKVRKTYLIMGQSVDVKDVAGSYQYIIGQDTWVEYWPTDGEGQTAAFKEKYIGIASLEQNLMDGCST